MLRFQGLLAAILFLLPACSYAEPSSDLIARLERLSDEGNADAHYYLGMAYHTGTGVEEDSSKALTLFRKAAESGSELGAYKLGCYYDGQGGELLDDDPAQALKYKLVAAKAGYALAQQDVAGLYARSGDMEAAVTWLERAVEQGWAQSLLTYASIYNGAPGITPDPVKTHAYFRLFTKFDGSSDKTVDWLRDFEQNMSAAERKEADEIVARYEPKPTQLTLTGLSGQRAAEILVAQQD